MDKNIIRFFIAVCFTITSLIKDTTICRRMRSAVVLRTDWQALEATSPRGPS